MDEKGVDNEQILQELMEFQSRDHLFSGGRVLSPMMTSALPISLQAHNMFADANLGNPGLYPGTKDMEKIVIEWMGKLVSAPDSMTGHITSGGTESNITALWMARKATGKKRVLFSKNAHFSLQKACDLLCMEAVEIPVGDNLMPDMDVLQKEAEKDVACIVGIAGTTEFGVVEPIKRMAELAPGAHFHVDAAFGGFVLPFMECQGEEYDFSILEVSSISLDPHKMGGAPIPSGALLLRGPDVAGDISVSSPYLTVEKHSGLLGTRCSASVASTYAAMRSLGRRGYVKRVKDCMAVTRFLVEKCKEMGIGLVREPVLNIVVMDVNDPRGIQKHLADKGWFVSCTREPEGLRVVVMPHVNEDVAEEFINTLATLLN